MLPIARWSMRLPRNISRPSVTRGIRVTARSQDRSSKHLLPCQPTERSKDASPSSSTVEAVSHALSSTPDSSNPLITPVHIPEDPHAVLKETHLAMRLLDNSSLVVQRQLEMMNVLMGFEQANRYVIMDPHGNHVGYLAEQEHGIGNAVARQMFRTHRSFTTHVFDREEREILRFHRPFSWISSRIRVYDATGKDEASYDNSTSLQGTSAGSIINQTSAKVSTLPLKEMRIVGAAEQEWAPLRRKYNMFVARVLEEDALANGVQQIESGSLPISTSKAVAVVEGDSREAGMLQFARVDEPFLSWDFGLMSEDGRQLGSVNRNFAGFAREIFTDTGVYVLRMDAAGLAKESANHISQVEESGRTSLDTQPGMTLDQRAVMLATAVSIDFDYFSRHSGSGGMWPMWMPMWMGGGEAAGGAAAGGAVVGEAGAAGTGALGAASEVGSVARGFGSAEGVAAGAGTMAGYEAMQRGRDAWQQQQESDDMSPQASDPQSPSDQQSPGEQNSEEVWGEFQDPGSNSKGPDQDAWGGQGGNGDGPDLDGGDAGGGGGGGGGGFSWSDFFE